MCSRALRDSCPTLFCVVLASYYTCFRASPTFCFTCSRTLRVLVLQVPCALRVLLLYVLPAQSFPVSHLPPAMHALNLDVSRTLRAIVPYVLSHLTCLTCSSTSYVLLCLKRCRAARPACPTCSCALHPSVASGVLNLTCSYVSHVS